MKELKYIDIAKLHPFEGHPFKVRDDEEMNSLIESIKHRALRSRFLSGRWETRWTNTR